jgi:hypothetical protein
VVTQPPRAASSIIVPAVRFIASPFGNSQPAFGRRPESNSTAREPALPIAENGPPKADIFALVAWGYTRPAPGANFRQNRKTLPMPLVRCAAFLLLIPAAMLLTGARNSQSPPKGSPPADSEAHAVAVKFLDDALARLDPGRVSWLEMQIRQKGRLGRYNIEAEGRYLAGPDNCFRLELTTRHGRASATMLAVSDGHSFQQGDRVGDGSWTNLIRLDLKHVLQCPRPAASTHVPGDEPRSPSFYGVVPLLRTLRSGITWSRTENVRRGDRRFIKLVGTVQDESSRTKPWPAGTPRRCRLYLDPSDLWPHRLEWWGPDSSNGSDTLLMQTEFRDPILNEALSADRCAREFTFPASVD